MSDDGTSAYAPRSPDLSSFSLDTVNTGKPRPAVTSVPNPLNVGNVSTYVHNRKANHLPQSPVTSPTSAWAPHHTASPSAATSTQAPPGSALYQNRRASLSQPYYTPPGGIAPAAHSEHHTPDPSLYATLNFPQPQELDRRYAVPRSAQAQNPAAYQSAITLSTFTHPVPQTLSHSQPPYYASVTPATSYLGSHNEGTDFQQADVHSLAMPPRRTAAAVLSDDGTAGPETNGIIVKTKFPTARIKRIMQADEEVGKVAQSTPIAVGKALELFMIQLVTKSADVARQKGSKRVSAQMLKDVIENDDQWDFLRDIASKVDETEKKGKPFKPEASESEDEVGETRRKGRGGRKKKTG